MWRPMGMFNHDERLPPRVDNHVFVNCPRSPGPTSGRVPRKARTECGSWYSGKRLGVGKGVEKLCESIPIASHLKRRAIRGIGYGTGWKSVAMEDGCRMHTCAIANWQTALRG